MKILFNNIKEILKPKVMIIALIIWLIYLLSGIQSFYFEEASVLKMIFFKLLHLLFLYVMTYILSIIYENRKNPIVKNGMIIFIVYCVIVFTFLVLIWPGGWSWDDINVLNYAKNYGILPWQHFISSFQYIVSLETIPFATGILIIQVLIIGMIVAYCVSSIADLLTKNKKTKIIYEVFLFLPCVLPPIIFFALSGFRMGLYSFFELLLIIKMLLVYYKKQKLSILECISIGALTIIVSSWRTEGIYYLVGVFLLLMLFCKKSVKTKTIIIMFIFCTISTLLIGKANNYLIGNNNYSITAIIEPLQSLIKNADTEKDQEEISDINKVIDVNMIYENPQWNGESYYWEGIVKNGYNSKEYFDMLMAYLKLIFKYPSVAFNSMWDVFINSTGVKVDNNGRTKQRTSINHTLEIFNLSVRYGTVWDKVDSYFKDPIFPQTRDTILKFLGGGVDSNNNVNKTYFVFWNLWIPITLIFLCFLYKIIKKDWVYVFIIMMIFCRIGLVFLTAASPYFMYYLSVYLISYILFVIIILQAINDRKNKRKYLQNILHT